MTAAVTNGQLPFRDTMYTLISMYVDSLMMAEIVSRNM
jgi:hypothetical protein